MQHRIPKALAAALVLCLAFTGTAFAKDKLKVGVTVLDLANPFFVEMTNAEKAAVEKMGGSITINDPKDDVSKQIEALENFIAAKCDAIIITAIDPKAVMPAIKKARAQGIVVIAHTDKLEEYDAWVAADEYDMGMTLGQEAGKWIKDRLGGKAEVAVLNYDLMPQVIKRKQGMIDGIKKYAPAAQVVADVLGGTPEKGMADAENFMQAHPNVKVIVSVNDGGALGALQAVKAAKKATPDFFIGGIDATQEALSKIAAGEVYRATVDQSAKTAGETCVDLALKAINKQPYQKDYHQQLKAVTTANIKDYVK
jgi:ABC-type sugar transport system substrate-binding protein